MADDSGPAMDHDATMTASTRQTFSELLQRHRGIVLKVAGTYARNEHDRADLAQEIAAQLWRAWPGFDPDQRFSTWMYRIALNVAITFVRGHVRREHMAVPFDETLHDIDDSQATTPEAQAQIERLYRFIDTLEPLNRALLLLYLDDCSSREIAEVLGISESNVTTRISRLKQRIRDHVA